MPAFDDRITSGAPDAVDISPGDLGAATAERLSELGMWPMCDVPFRAAFDHSANANLTAVIDACPLAMMLLDFHGTVRLWNPACERIFGWTAAETVGKILPSIPEGRHAEFLAYLDKVRSGERVTSVETTRQRKDQVVIDINLWTVSIVDSDGRASCLSMVTDISERKGEERVRTFLGKVSDALATSLDYEETLARVARMSVSSLGDYCEVYITDGVSRLDRVAVAHADPAREAVARTLLGRLSLDLTVDAPTSRAVRTGKSVLESIAVDSVIAATTFTSEYGLTLAALRAGSAMSIPLRARGDILGAIFLVRDEGKAAYTADDLRLAEELADRAALAIQNAKLFERQQEARRAAEAATERTRRLQELTSGLAAARVPDEVAAVVVTNGVAALGAMTGIVWHLSGDGSHLEIVQSIGYPAPLIDPIRRVPVSAISPVTDAVSLSIPLWIESPEDLSRRYPTSDEIPALAYSRAWAIVPLTSDGQTRGAFTMSWAQPRRFSSDERSFTQTLAQQGAQALERASFLVAEQKARKAAETSQQRAAALAETTRQLVEASLDSPEVLDIVGRRVATVVGDGSLIVLLTPDGFRFEVPAVHHPDPEAQSLARQLLEAFPPSRKGSLADRVLLTGRPIVIPEVSPELLLEIVRPEQASYARRFGFNSLAVVTLRARGRIIGILGAWRDGPGRPYTDDDVRLIQELADRAASAIENARLYAESRAAIQLRDEFLTTAAHELKTPLTGIRSSVQLLARVLDRHGKVDSERLFRLLGVIDRQSGKLALLVAQLFDVARLDGGKLVLEKKLVDLVGLVADVVASNEARLGGPGILVVAPDRLSATVDALRIEQVVTNLIDNAIKFSPKGTPVIVEVASTNNEAATIAVTDHGIGIPLERRAVIFDRFSPARADDYLSGLGLGLYISRQITELHGGTLEAEFPDGGGTRFIVHLPTGNAVDGAPG